MNQENKMQCVQILFAMLALAGGTVVSAADDERIEQLGYGYTAFYDTAEQLSLVDKALWLKVESDGVDALVTRMAKTMGALADELEVLASQSPAVSLEDDGLPKYERAKRQSVTIQRSLDLGAPLLGRSGRDFERVLLLSLTAALNQQRHLLKVMQGDEPSAQRAQWLKDAKQTIDQQYEAMVVHLQRHYFSD